MNLIIKEYSNKNSCLEKVTFLFSNLVNEGYFCCLWNNGTAISLAYYCQILQPWINSNNGMKDHMPLISHFSLYIT